MQRRKHDAARRSVDATLLDMFARGGPMRPICPQRNPRVYMLNAAESHYRRVSELLECEHARLVALWDK